MDVRSKPRLARVIRISPRRPLGKLAEVPRLKGGEEGRKKQASISKIYPP